FLRRVGSSARRISTVAVPSAATRRSRSRSQDPYTTSADANRERPQPSAAVDSPAVAVAQSSTAEDLASLTGWITATNASDEAINHIARSTARLAEVHTQIPPRDVLADVLRLHQHARALLRSGKQRLRQTRDLIKLDGDLLAHACVLLGDLNRDRAAEQYGHAALLFLQEAEANPAVAWYALAKTARWKHKYAEAADLAAQGAEPRPANATTLQLASYEANSAALNGDISRARRALIRADKVAENLPAAATNSLSVWSFPMERRAIFNLSVALRAGDPSAALGAAGEADARWAAGDPHIPSTWAQIRAGAASARLMQGSLDGVAEEVTPVLALPSEFRIATVTGWLADLDRGLTQRRFANSPLAIDLRQQIREFRAAPPEP
ncbi:MAG: hypothetical protein J2P27_07230, partial [Actinobacteria bacterium]|nr:hypothetical protein [Actinomycetota bacterium]